MKTRRAANERISALFKLDLPFKQRNLCLLGLRRAPSGVCGQGQAEKQQIHTAFHQGSSPTPASKLTQAGKRQQSTGLMGPSCSKCHYDPCLFSWCESGQSDLSGNLGFLCFFILLNIFIFLYVWVFCPHVCQGATYMLGTHGGQKQDLCFF